jgi:hypothetical protein
MPDNHIEKYVSTLRMNGFYDIADCLYFLKLERDAAVRNLQSWSCNTCSRHGKRELCDVCNRNRVLIARGCALSKDMYKWKAPEDV